MYLERLKMGNHWELKIHAYRAIIEKLIAKKWPYMIHSPLANVKYTKELTFPRYIIMLFAYNFIDNKFISVIAKKL